MRQESWRADPRLLLAGHGQPSAAIIDSQSVDASETVGEDSRGYDGGKSRDGRKRHILTVTTADVHDSKTAPALLETFMDQPGRLLKLVWVDSAYQGPARAKAFARHGVRIEVVRRSDGQRGFCRTGPQVGPGAHAEPAGETPRPTAPGAGMNRPSSARTSQPRFSST
ncbi:transposase [Streptomyces sp. NPDC050121]|uniref:transposase n=1 Tax=Streptomyces sp. NPDC050121 TaxID=3365601 RepID=UPI00378D1E32